MLPKQSIKKTACNALFCEYNQYAGFAEFSFDTSMQPPHDKRTFVIVFKLPRRKIGITVDGAP